MKDTLRLTTQKRIIHAVHPLHLRYRVDNMQLNRKRLNAQFYTDHLLAKYKSLKGTREHGLTLLKSSLWPFYAESVQNYDMPYDYFMMMLIYRTY